MVVRPPANIGIITFLSLLTAIIIPLPISGDQKILVTPARGTYRGALVDDYEPAVMLIKIASPGDIYKDSMINIDGTSQFLNTVREVYGATEIVYQERFNDLLEDFRALLPSDIPVVDESAGNIIDIGPLLPSRDHNDHRRTRRGAAAAIRVILRSIIPATRSAGRLTKFGKFAKGIRYLSYGASAAVVGYEIADALGAIPDPELERIMAEIDQLHQGREKDLEVMGNISLLSSRLSSGVEGITKNLKGVLLKFENKIELYVRVSSLMDSYLNTIRSAFFLLLDGKLPSSLVNLDTQRDWLERNIPSPLLPHIGTISPHLELKFKGIDIEKGVLILTIKIPVMSSRFQLMNFSPWEPRVHLKAGCYTSPKEYLYLAYTANSNKGGVITNALLVSPESCQDEGFIICETDAILDKISDLKEDPLCMIDPGYQGSRNKREVSRPDSIILSNYPKFDLTNTLKPSLMNLNSTNISKEFEDLYKTIKLLKEDNQVARSNFTAEIAKARGERIQIFVLWVLLGGTLSGPLVYLCRMGYEKIKERRKNRIRIPKFKEIIVPQAIQGSDPQTTEIIPLRQTTLVAK